MHIKKKKKRNLENNSLLQLLCGKLEFAIALEDCSLNDVTEVIM